MYVRECFRVCALFVRVRLRSPMGVCVSEVCILIHTHFQFVYKAHKERELSGNRSNSLTKRAPLFFIFIVWASLLSSWKFKRDIKFIEIISKGIETSILKCKTTTVNVYTNRLKKKKGNHNSFWISYKVRQAAVNLQKLISFPVQTARPVSIDFW